MKWLITGANGVVGKNLSDILVRRYEFNVWKCGRATGHDDKYIQIDLTNRIEVSDFFAREKFDSVVHLAANINDYDSLTTFNDNIISTLNVVKASLSTQVKKIFYSSSVPVIGEILELPITETHPVKPPSLYHLSKFYGEQLIAHNCVNKLDFINMRIPSPVGRNMPPRSVFPIFLEKIKNSEHIILTGDREHRQNYLDIRDLARFIHQASLLDGISGLFNVASNYTYSNLELAQSIISATNTDSQIINNMFQCGSGIKNWDISCEKAKKFFSYRPIFTLEETIEWILGS